MQTGNDDLGVEFLDGVGVCALLEQVCVIVGVSVMGFCVCCNTDEGL